MGERMLVLALKLIAQLVLTDPDRAIDRPAPAVGLVDRELLDVELLALFLGRRSAQSTVASRA